MQRAIELHDSEVISIHELETAVIVRLDVYIHASPARPGIDRGTGWTQEAVLVLERACVDERPSDDELRISDGALTDGPRLHDNLVPLPFATSQPVTVTFSGAEGRLSARGENGELFLLGEPRYVEDFEP